MAKNDESEARLAYETSVGKRVSDNHWYNVRRILQDNGFEVNTDSVLFYAKLRKSLPRSSVGVLKIFENYQKAEKLLAQAPQQIKGIEILSILHQYEIIPHASTISRWFSSLGGYRKKKLYKAEDLKTVFTAAFIYKAQHSTKLPEVI